MLHENTVITSKLFNFVTKALHDKALGDHVIREAGWTQQTFQLADWDAHERAFWRILRFTRHYTSKMIHSLLNTNRQNRIYYGKFDQCPFCQTSEETMEHIFLCQHATAAQTRRHQLQVLLDTLAGANTPKLIVDTIRRGFTSWEAAPLHPVRATTAESLCGPDAVLTSAFHEQFHHLGWFHFCLGQVSNGWQPPGNTYQESNLLILKNTGPLC